MGNGIGGLGGRVTLGGCAVGCKVGSRVRITIGEQGNALSIWKWGDLVGETEGVGVGSVMRGIEVRGRVIMGGDVGVVDGATLGSGTGDVRAMVSLH